MGMIDVRINSEETLEDGLDHRYKILREGNAWIIIQLPIWQGNKASLLNWLSTHVISSSIYSGAGTFKGVFTFCPSAQRYSNFCPALMMGQDYLVQYSVRVP
jgi:hypothetical protein